MSKVPPPPSLPNSQNKIRPPKRKLYRGMAAILRDASKSSENLSQGKTRNQSKIPVRSKSANPTSGEESDLDHPHDVGEADYELLNYDMMFTSESSSEDESAAQREHPEKQTVQREMALILRDIGNDIERENSPSSTPPKTSPSGSSPTIDMLSVPRSKPRAGRATDRSQSSEATTTVQPNVLEEVQKLAQVSQSVAQQLSRLEALDQRVSDAIDKSLDQKLQTKVEQAINTTLKEIHTSPAQVSSMVKEAIAAEFEKGLSDTYFERANNNLLEKIKTAITDPMETKIQQIDASLENTKVDLINVEKDLKQKYINNATSIVQVNNEIKKQRDDIKHLTRDVTTLQQAEPNGMPNGDLKKMETMIDDLEQRVKAQNIFLTGPAVPQDITEVIPTLNDLLSLSLSTNDVTQIIPIKSKQQTSNDTTRTSDNQADQATSTIDTQSKRPKKAQPPTTIAYKIIFTDVATQKKVMKQKTKLQGKKLWLNADLTKKRYEVYKEATKLKKDGKIARVWADNGKVLCKITADSPVIPFNPEDYKDQD